MNNMNLYFASVIHADGTTTEGITMAANPITAENRVRHFIETRFPPEQHAIDIAIIKAQGGRNTIQVNWVAGS